MVVIVNERKPRSFGIKGAAVIISISILLGLFLKFTDKTTNSDEHKKSTSKYFSVSHLIPEILLSVNRGSPEKKWTEALAKKLGGESEVKIENGRVDVLTETYAIEIDFIRKWQEGLGQAIHYGMALDKISVLAIIYDSKNDESRALIKKIEKITMAKDVKLIILRPEHGEHN